MHYSYLTFTTIIMHFFVKFYLLLNVKLLLIKENFFFSINLVLLLLEIEEELFLDF